MCSQSATCHTTGAALIVSGYGQRVSDSSASIPNSLVFADLFAISQNQCASKWNSNFQCSNCLPATNVCAGSNPTNANPAKDSCFGDSGGPLVRNFGTTVAPDFRQVGVVSSGTVPQGSSLDSCGAVGEYGVYVSVPENLVWIQSVMSGGQNASAITSACVATGTCTSGGGTVIPPSGTGAPFSFYYVVMGAVAGIILLMLILICVCKACTRCNKRQPPREQRAAPARMETYVVSSPPPAVAPHTTYNVQVATAPPPPAVVAPPVYQQNPGQMYGAQYPPAAQPVGNYGIPPPTYYNEAPPVFNPNGGNAPPPQNPYQ
jgi:hypothetical protein